MSYAEAGVGVPLKRGNNNTENVYVWRDEAQEFVNMLNKSFGNKIKDEMNLTGRTIRVLAHNVSS